MIMSRSSLLQLVCPHSLSSEKHELPSNYYLCEMKTSPPRGTLPLFPMGRLRGMQALQLIVSGYGCIFHDVIERSYDVCRFQHRDPLGSVTLEQSGTLRYCECCGDLRFYNVLPVRIFVVVDDDLVVYWLPCCSGQLVELQL